MKILYVKPHTRLEFLCRSGELSSCQEGMAEASMWDVVMIAAGGGLFGVAILYAFLCERL